MPVNLINRATGSFPYSCPTIETTDPFTWGGTFRDTLQVLADRTQVLLLNPVLYQKTYVNAVAATTTWTQVSNSSTNISNCKAGDIIEVSANWAQSAVSSGYFVAGRISIYDPVNEKYHPSTLNSDLLWRDNFIYTVPEDAAAQYVVFIDQVLRTGGTSERLAVVQYVVKHYKRGL